MAGRPARPVPTKFCADLPKGRSASSIIAPYAPEIATPTLPLRSSGGYARRSAAQVPVDRTVMCRPEYYTQKHMPDHVQLTYHGVYKYTILQQGKKNLFADI